MNIQIYLALSLIQYSPDNQRSYSLEIDPFSKVGDVLSKLNMPPNEPVLITINERQVSPETVVNDGDSLRLFPLLSGG
jgi:sulfur carrier protein ThiS